MTWLRKELMRRREIVLRSDDSDYTDSVIDTAAFVALLDGILAIDAAGPWPKVAYTHRSNYSCVHCAAASVHQSTIDHRPDCEGIILRDSLMTLKIVLHQGRIRDAG